MPGTTQRLRTERGFGFIRDVQGGEVLFPYTVLPSPDHFTALTIEMVAEFEPEPSPKGSCHQGHARARTLLIRQHPRGHRPGVRVGQAGTAALTVAGSTHQT